MERLSALSSAFLDAEDEDPKASLAIGSLAIFEGPAPTFEDFAGSIESRLPQIPRYRQKLRTMPFDLAPPEWVDDADFDPSEHILRVTVPAPGGRDEIGVLLSRVMTQRMDRSRPLWEYWFCEGLSDGRWGLLSKLHHSMVDGVSGSDLYHLVLDPNRTPAPVPEVEDSFPEPPASTLSFTGRAIRDSALRPLAGARAVVGALRSPKRAAIRAGLTAKGLVAFGGALRPVSGSSLNGPLDGQRRYAWTTISIAEIREVRRCFGVTLNDVALTAVTGGFQKLLLSRGEQPNAHTLRSLVPVSTRAAGDESIQDNRVSLMLPYLPVHLTTPRERLDAVHESIIALRSAGEAVAGDSVTTAAGYGLFPSVALGIRLGMHLPQRVLSAVTTNVPGPRVPLYALGRELEEILPYVPIADRVRIGVAIYSYRDALVFGITADHGSVPDIQVLADAIAASMAELSELAHATW